MLAPHCRPACVPTWERGWSLPGSGLEQFRCNALQRANPRSGFLRTAFIRELVDVPEHLEDHARLARCHLYIGFRGTETARSFQAA